MVEVEALYDYSAEQDDELTIKKGDIIINVVHADNGWFEGELNERKGVFPDNFVKIVLSADSKSPTKVVVNMNTSDSNVNFRKEKKRRCKVLFSYQPVNDDELPLEVDSIIDVVEEVEEGWWKGVVNGKSGVFPSNFVEELEVIEVEQESVPPKSEKILTQEATAEIKPRPVRGVGYGNIFQDGKIKLRATPVQETKPPASPVNKKSPFSNAVVTSNTDAPQLPPKRVKEQAIVLFSYEAQNDDELSLKEGDTINIISKDAEDLGWWKGELNGNIGVFPDNFVQLIVFEEPKPKKPDRPEKMPNIMKGPPKPDRDSADGSVNWRDKSENVSSPTRKERVSSLPRGLSSKRLPPDIPKKDEKIDRSGPPLPGKKPQLPPPMKKVGRISASFGGTVSTTATAPAHPANANADILFGEAAPKIELPKAENVSNDSDLDVVETSSEKLVHLTAQRARNPNRRPPSHVFLKGDNNNGLHEKENGEASETETPWMRELRKNQAVKRNSHVFNEIISIKDSIPEVDEKTLPRGSSLKSIEVEEKLSNRISSNCFKKNTPPLTSPIKPKSLSLNNEVDSKESLKIEKTVTTSTTSAEALSLPPLTGEPTLAELAKLYNFLRENCAAKSEYLELKRECTDLRNSFDTFKALTSRRITELSNEVETEKSQRQALQAELDRLKTQWVKK